MQLQREHGIAENELCDFFIHCYGARLSLNPGILWKRKTKN